jgi:hypothetical protein
LTETVALYFIEVDQPWEEDLVTERRELYRSPNGDTWYLGREPQNGRAFIIHQPNAPSGGRLSHIELSAFLSGGDGPEHRALLRLIATLVDLPPFGERT